jgi:hypothetical protein
LYSLETCDNTTDWKEVLKSIESGTDNRNIHDDGQVSSTEIRHWISKFQLFSAFSHKR